MGILRAAAKTAWREYLRTHHPIFKFKILQFWDHLSTERRKEAEAALERAHRHWNNFSLDEKLVYIRMLDSTARKGKHYYALLEFAGRCHLDIAKQLISTNFGKEAHAHARSASRHLKRAISVNEHHHMAHFLLGVALEIQDQRKQARKCYKRANKLDPLDANVINALKRLSN